MLPLNLLSRSLGDISPCVLKTEYSTQLLRALQPAPHVRFDTAQRVEERRQTEAPRRGEILEDENDAFAHQAGVNALAVEKFEGRYLVSGGADGRILMWDLDAASDATHDGRGSVTHQPLGTVQKSPSSHAYGITGLSFYPFDSLAFFSSSYDHSLKIYSSETLEPSASFSLGSVVYSHSISPIASHLLVACATQHPSVRLVDLRSGASTHSLTGHGGGTVLSVAWSPRHEHILASGASDGNVRFWDVRRSAANLGVLDMEDSVGVAGHDGLGKVARRRERGRAHNGMVNGLLWTENGRNMVTTGHDERIRVWDTTTGANTLANFGPIIKNSHVSVVSPALAPRSVVRPGDDVLFFPNEREILMYEMFEGRLLKRLKPSTRLQALPENMRGHRNIINRVTTVCWRRHKVELLSAHTDGTIRSWQPRTTTDAIVEEAERGEEDSESSESDIRKRKRRTLEGIHRDLTTPKITFI